MSKIKNFKYYLDEQITIDDYLYMYYNFKRGAFTTLTHKTVKNSFPFIKRKKTENVTRENILKGEVLLVKDCEGTVLAYQNPFAEQEEDNEDILYADDYQSILESREERLERHLDNIKDNQKIEIIITVEDDIDKLTELTEEDLEKMNCYQLAKTKKELEEQNNQKLNRLVQKELYFRKGTEHGNKKGKLRKLIKSEERNDLND